MVLALVQQHHQIRAQMTSLSVAIKNFLEKYKSQEEPKPRPSRALKRQRY